MRDLFTIIEDVKDGGRPDYDELRLALVALSGIAHFDKMAIMAMATKPDKLFYNPEFQYKESFNRWKRILAHDPETILGENHHPDKEACKRLRRAAFNIARKVGLDIDEPRSPTLVEEFDDHICPGELIIKSVCCERSSFPIVNRCDGSVSLRCTGCGNHMAHVVITPEPVADVSMKKAECSCESCLGRDTEEPT